MTKFCPKCLQTLLRDEFHAKSASEDGLQAVCKSCRKRYDHDRFKRLPLEEKAQRVAQTKANRRANGLKLLAYLAEHPCVDCGEADPIVLEFDHVGPKSFTISDAIGQGYSWPTIEKEIAKCVVRCANCHRRKTAHESGWINKFQKAA